MDANATLAPRTLFESYFRSADVLLKVYRLLAAVDVRETGEVVDRARGIVAAEADEALICLINDLFMGVVRERAQLTQRFFGHPNLAMLLRQAVVTSCTAMDVFFPELLRQHLPLVIRIKQRNFIQRDRQVNDFFQGFSLSLDEHLRIVEDPDQQHQQLGNALLRHIEKKTMSNVPSITVALKLLGFDEPWDALGAHLGRRPAELQTPVEELVSRRNDIVHRGDRPKGSATDAPNDLSYAWASARIDAAKHVVLACDELVTRRMAEYAALLPAAE